MAAKVRLTSNFVKSLSSGFGIVNKPDFENLSSLKWGLKTTTEEGRTKALVERISKSPFAQPLLIEPSPVHRRG